MTSKMPAVFVHLDEIDAAMAGERFLKEQSLLHTNKSLRRVPQPDDGEAALPFKGVAMMDHNDTILAIYFLNRDAMNRTRLTLISLAT